MLRPSSLHVAYFNFRYVLGFFTQVMLSVICEGMHGGSSSDIENVPNISCPGGQQTIDKPGEQTMNTA